MKDSRQCLPLPSLRAPYRGRGYSLYDTLVTLTVVSVVATIGVPAFKQIISAQRMNTAVNTMVTALHLTRSEAIRRGERAVLCPSSDGLSCQGNGATTGWHHGFLLYIDENANRERDAGEYVIRTFSTAPGIRIQSSRGRTPVTYQANGLASGTNATFSFCPDNPGTPARTVVLANSGRPRVTRVSTATAC